MADTRRDEEKDLVRITLNALSLEQIAEHRHAGETRCAVLAVAFVVKEDAADDCRSAIGNGDLRQHALRVDRGAAPATMVEVELFSATTLRMTVP